MSKLNAIFVGVANVCGELFFVEGPNALVGQLKGLKDILGAPLCGTGHFVGCNLQTQIFNRKTVKFLRVFNHRFIAARAHVVQNGRHGSIHVLSFFAFVAKHGGKLLRERRVGAVQANGHALSGLGHISLSLSGICPRISLWASNLSPLRRFSLIEGCSSRFLRRDHARAFVRRPIQILDQKAMHPDIQR